MNLLKSAIRLDDLALSKPGTSTSRTDKLLQKGKNRSEISTIFGGKFTTLPKIKALTETLPARFEHKVTRRLILFLGVWE